MSRRVTIEINVDKIGQLLENIDYYARQLNTNAIETRTKELRDYLKWCELNASFNKEE